jgi:hypothetical protein
MESSLCLADLLTAREPDFEAAEEHGTGKSREPAGWKACATGRFMGRANVMHKYIVF